MKKWSNEEIAALKDAVIEHNNVSKGIRAFMITHPERSFQACSHVIYRRPKDTDGPENVVMHEIPVAPAVPAAGALKPASTEAPSIPEKKSFWKKLIGLFIKPKTVLC